MEAMQRKLFVGGVLREATEATLRDYFSKFGELDDCVIINDRSTGCSKGFGFVSFTEPPMVEHALNQHHHVILGRKVDVKPARPRGHRDQEHANNSYWGNDDTEPIRVKKIFVGGLPDGFTVSEFKTYFDQYGSIDDVVVMHDEDGKPRGFGFITFESEDAASSALQERFHELKGKTVEVKRAEPQKRLVYDLVETYDSYYDAGLSFPPWRCFGSFVYPLPVVYYPYGYQCYPQFNSSGITRPSFVNGESEKDSDGNASMDCLTSEKSKTGKEIEFLDLSEENDNQTETDENVSMGENVSSESSENNIAETILL